MLVLVIFLFHHIHYKSPQKGPASREGPQQCVIDKGAFWKYRQRESNKQHKFSTKLEGKLCSGKKCPNIIYLLVDDLGYGDVGYNGGIAHTPNLNRMAHGPHSVHFTRFYAGGPTCSPTRGTLLTGRNHNRYCIWHADLGNAEHDLTCPSLGPLPPSEVTVAEILQEAGYHTSIYGKWHVGDLKAIKGGNTRWNVSHPGMHGFKDWWVTERHISTMLSNCKCSSDCPCAFEGRHYLVQFCRNYWGMDPETGELVKYPMQVLDDSHFVVDQLEKLLKNRNSSVPFFSILAFHSVHSPFLAMPNWFDYYGKEGFEGQQKHYLGSVSGVDEAIGRVRRLLDQYGVYNDTLLWFSSDNGPQTGEPGSTGGLRGRKGFVWEGGIRVPGIIEWPAVISRNRVSSAPVVTSDFLPTVADIIGVHLPSTITYDGMSILPLLQNKTDKRGKNINFAFHIKKGKLDSDFFGAVVGDQYKYYAEFNGGKIQKFYLFDLDREANEVTNVSMFYPQRTHSMKAELDVFLKSVTESAAEVGCLETHDRRTVNC